MEDPSNAPKPDTPPELPPPLKPSNILDSIFRSDGPMPPASIGIRGLAFFLDFILLLAFSLVFVWKFTMPQSHPGALHEMTEFFRAFIDWMALIKTQPDATPPEVSQSLKAALAHDLNLRFIIMWVYFGIGEAFFGGSSLGKKLCCIRTVSTVTLGTQPIMTGIVRGGLKTLTVFVIYPFSTPLALIGLLFNKRSQLVHDLASRTAVIDERKVDLHS
ncbi:MAG: RDD family protein [Opitutaceae bacterium]